MSGVRKSNTAQHETFRGRHRFEHWYRDRSVYFITARCRDRAPALASPKAKAVFWDRLTHHAAAARFILYIASLLDNHYHLMGFLERGDDLPRLMQGLHGSVAKLVNDLLPVRLTPFWLDHRLKNYFDGCLRDEHQLDRTYRYILRQPVRHGICADPGDYPHTRIYMTYDQALRFTLHRDALLRGVPYKRYQKRRRE